MNVILRKYIKLGYFVKIVFKINSRLFIYMDLKSNNNSIKHQISVKENEIFTTLKWKLG